MREYKTSKLFEKHTSKLKGQELKNLLNKIDEILAVSDSNHYKNLQHSLKQFKRVHVNTSFVIIFFDKTNVVHFVDYAHHDVIYARDKKTLPKYKELQFG